MVFTNKQPPEEILAILKDASVPLEVVDTQIERSENE
jgi:DeoR family glycerol-3-phosphate regulon repressor